MLSSINSPLLSQAVFLCNSILLLNALILAFARIVQTLTVVLFLFFLFFAYAFDKLSALSGLLKCSDPAPKVKRLDTLDIIPYKLNIKGNINKKV